MMATNEAADFERRNTDPTIPIDGADPENMAGPFSNVELEIAARKHVAFADDDEATRLRPAFADQARRSGDAITDSDVLANPAAGLEVAEDSGADERREADEARGVAGQTSNPVSGSTSGSGGESGTGSGGGSTPAKKAAPAAKR
jgi:hypothetical protein